MLRRVVLRRNKRYEAVIRAKLEATGIFDRTFYLAQYPDVAKLGDDPLTHFIRHGAGEGRSPAFGVEISPTLRSTATGGDEVVASLNLVEAWLRIVAPAQKGQVTEGHAVSPLFNPALEEAADVALMRTEFDAGFYQAENADVDFARIDPFTHFVTQGWREWRDPNAVFSVRDYLDLHPDVRLTGMNPFSHYLTFGRTEKRQTKSSEKSHSPSARMKNTLSGSQSDATSEMDQSQKSQFDLMSEFMDIDYYKEQAQGVDFSFFSPAEHYAMVGWRLGLNPSRTFSTSAYLSANADVASAGVNPLLHYVLAGREEGRTWPADSMTPHSGAAIAPSVQVEPPAGDGKSEWAAYRYLRDRSWDSFESKEPDLAAVGFVVTLLGADLTEALDGMKFRREGGDDDITISIVIPCINEEVITAECLKSIASALPQTFGIEVIVADNGSTDGLYRAIAHHPEIRYIRFAQNIGFGPACNAAAEAARGDYLLLLNNDAQIAPQCLERLLAAFDDPAGDVGMVGPKFLSFDGHLQEAGCLLNADGTAQLIGFGRNPATPRYNYRRTAEHISGAAVLIRRDVFSSFGGFDPIYAPAYCEDADLTLKLRQAGLKIVYEPTAVIAHHLSKTSAKVGTPSTAKAQLIARNRQTLRSRWLDRLTQTDLRTIAFYLPQYHPIPENDLWWGKGFTEWRNVAKTRPNYVGHNQPRHPLDLGYYDLRLPEVLEHQAALARRYGVTGFCYYYYSFPNGRLLERPTEQMLKTGRPDLPFCLCWANENWTRRWDGLDNEILMRQTYSDEHMIAIADDLCRYFETNQYIRVDGKPLFLVYRIKNLPNPKRNVETWRNRCRRNGIGEICIASVESFELSASPEDPRNYGCDLSVEFPAHGMFNDPPMQVERINPSWTGAVHDYRELALAFMRRVEVGFPRLRSVLVGWDSTPRHPDRSVILENATPGAFQAWLEWTYRRTMEQNHGDHRIVFVNAWNEWAEGSYLEPDRRYGHAYLEAVRNALDTVETGGVDFDL